MTRTEAHLLLTQYISSPSLQRHSQMVATALEAYAQSLGQNEEDWYVAGLLHDLDWEQFPDEHPNKAIQEILPQHGVKPEILAAIAAHAPQRTGKPAQTLLDKYLFACDEISGFIDAVAKVRPNGLADLQWSSVKKKLKDKAFAANVSREDITQGAELIGQPLNTHVDFLIATFQKLPVTAP